VLEGPVDRLTVVDRIKRVAILPDDLPRQPFHAAEGKDRAAAEQILAEVEEAARAWSRKLLETLRHAHGITAVGVTLGSGRRPPDDMGRILAVHAMQHSAEGWLYRDALLDAAADLGLAAVGAVESELDEVWATALGRGLGPPWAKDQKLAAAVAREALR
jgi:hypothetical protein